jgi:hypothetical protein
MVTLIWRCTRADNLEQVFIDNGREVYASVDKCECKAFHYNGSCPHTIALRERLCTWRSDALDAVALDPAHPTQCPLCGYRVAVYAAPGGEHDAP